MILVLTSFEGTPNMARFMMALRKTAGIAVLFTPQSVDFAQRTIQGRATISP
ncbi:MAG: hypothetical protein ACM3TT_09690 [Syntrophothermus sp.]